MEKKDLIEKLNNLFAIEDVVSKDELLASKVLKVLEVELDKAREEGIFTQWELEYIRELAKEDRLFTRNVVEYNTDTELIKKISNLLKTKEDEK